jgi:hypothetical protein
MNLHGYEYEYGIFSWIISVDISVLLKIYGYEYEYAKFSWILSMGSPKEGAEFIRHKSIAGRSSISAYYIVWTRVLTTLL